MSTPTALGHRCSRRSTGPRVLHPLHDADGLDLGVALAECRLLSQIQGVAYELSRHAVWSRLRESNSGPTHYEIRSGVAPGCLEVRRRACQGGQVRRRAGLCRWVAASVAARIPYWIPSRKPD